MNERMTLTIGEYLTVIILLHIDIPRSVCLAVKEGFPLSILRQFSRGKSPAGQRISLPKSPMLDATHGPLDLHEF
jgi:hypothetical protein